MSDLDDPKGRDDLKALAKAMRRPLDTLYALTTNNDPFMAELPSRLGPARWFARLYLDLKFQVGSHVRRILYLLVSQQSGYYGAVETSFVISQHGNYSPQILHALRTAKPRTAFELALEGRDIPII